eukprot:2875572-Rhodomonas_salina.2
MLLRIADPRRWPDEDQMPALAASYLSARKSTCAHCAIRSCSKVMGSPACTRRTKCERSCTQGESVVVAKDGVGKADSGVDEMGHAGF